MIVDSHQHFWQVGRFDYPWMSLKVEVLCRDYLPPALASVLNRNGVDKTILVQASNSLEETRWLLSLASTLIYRWSSRLGELTERRRRPAVR